MSGEAKLLQDIDIIKNLHGPFFPSDIRAGEPLSATVFTSEFEEGVEMRVWRLSPLGVELLANENNNFINSLVMGKKINLNLQIADQHLNFEGLLVDEVREELGRKVFGVRIVVPEIPREIGTDRRKEQRWVCATQFLPTGMAPNPAKYNDFIFFRVKDVSANGMQLLTSLRNKFLVPGMKIEANISFPMVTQSRVSFRITNVRPIKEMGTDYLSLGVQFLEKDTDVMEAIGQYLAQFGLVDSLSSLHEQGLNSRSISKSVAFSYVRTEEEYKEVLRLRFEAYKMEGKLSPNYSVNDMGDIYDTRSRIVIGRYNGQIVATGRMTFNEYDQNFEQENFVKWTEDLPARHESVEIMRVCTHPEFRGSDLLFAMFKFMAVAVVQSRRDWIVLSTTEKYVPLYLKMGGVYTGSSFKLPKLNNTEHKLIVGNVRDSITGKNLSPIMWNLIYGDVVGYLEGNNHFQLTSAERMRVNIYRLFSPLANFVLKYVISPRKEERAKLKKIDRNHI